MSGAHTRGKRQEARVLTLYSVIEGLLFCVGFGSKFLILAACFLQGLPCLLPLISQRRYILMSTIVSASLLSADVLRLGEELERIEKSGCGHVHFDVMDGVFVDNISFGIPMLKGIRKGTRLPVDVHLMITSPEKYISAFLEAGADMISFHTECTDDPAALLSMIRRGGAKAGLAVKPKTPLERVLPYAKYADYILQMTVEPGFGGQAFIPSVLERIREIKGRISEEGLQTLIQVDGGINAETAQAAVGAGADILVAGSYLFNAEDMREAAKKLKGNGN
ncbi:MAG: ribulose-phosphate 3-epimerase [Ruminococcus sp.]|nr:ribulose-phosphate 3-epimerase [Ruminococcus sp.]